MSDDKFIARAERAVKMLRQMRLPDGYNQQALNAAANIIETLLAEQKQVISYASCNCVVMTNGIVDISENCPLHSGRAK